MIRLQYQLTLEEFASAYDVSMASKPKRGKQKRTRVKVMLIGWLSVLALIWIWIVCSNMRDVRPMEGWSSSSLGEYFSVAAPWCALIFLTLSINALRPHRIRKLALLLQGLVAGALFAFEVYYIRWYWSLSLGWYWVAIVYYSVWKLLVTRTGHRKMWDGQPHLHDIHTLSFDDDSLTITTPLSTTYYRWPAIRGWLDMPRLILVYVSEFSFHIVPKRAFSSEAEVDAFTALLTEKTVVANSAFPVQLVTPIAEPLSDRPADNSSPVSELPKAH